MLLFYRGDEERGGGMMGGFGGSMGGIANAGKSKRPINVKFEIPYFTTSGIQVRYLKIIEPKVCVIKILSARRVGAVPNMPPVPVFAHYQRQSILLLAQVLTSGSLLVAIPIATLGTLHYAVGRHRSAVTGGASLRPDRNNVDDKTKYTLIERSVNA